MQPEPGADTNYAEKGGNTSFEIDGHAYVGLELGVTSASTPTRAMAVAMKIQRSVREIANLVADPKGQFIAQAGEITDELSFH